MGSFEIYCNKTLLFSKLRLGYFPHVQSVTNRIMNFIDDYRNDRDTKKYTENKKRNSFGKTNNDTWANGFQKDHSDQSFSKSPRRIKYNPTSQSVGADE
jgi:hypothetical protein